MNTQEGTMVKLQAFYCAGIHHTKKCFYHLVLKLFQIRNPLTLYKNIFSVYHYLTRSAEKSVSI